METKDTQVPAGLDPKAFYLTKAIKKTETEGQPDPYNARGKSGETGAYQFMPQTWKEWAKNYEGDENLPMTPENQNKIAYKRVKHLMDQGLKPSEIAAKWNSGRTNAAQVGTGINSQGVSYDVPGYVNRVKQAYESLLPTTANAQAPSSAPTQQPPQKDGILKSIYKGIAGPVANLIARPGQLVQHAIGGDTQPIEGKFLGLDITDPYADVQRGQSPTSTVLKDVGRGAQTVALGLPVGSIGSAAATGALAGAGGSLESTGEIGADTAKGALLGSVFGAGGGLLAKGVASGTQAAARSFARQALQGADEGTIKYALSKGISNVDKGLSVVNDELRNTGSAVDDLLSKAQASGRGIRGGAGASNDATRQTLVEFQNSKLFQTPKGEPFIPENANLMEGMNAQQGLIEQGNKKAVQNLSKTLKQAVPNQVSLVDKVVSGEATLAEKNALRSALDRATYDTTDPTSTFRKQVAKKMADNLRNEIKSWVPDSIPLFEQQANALKLKDALEVAQQAQNKTKGFGVRDIGSIVAGSTLGGPIGAAGAFALDRASRSPNTDLLAAKGLMKLQKPIRAVGKGLVRSATTGSGLITRKP